jgi:uncharacterized protein YjbJ (UPF0337 family)
MHKDEAQGKGKEAAGNIKDAVGQLTGDQRLRDEAAGDKAEGKLQQGVGKIKEAARDALKR